MTLSPGGTRTQAATGGTTPYIYTSSQPAVATVDAAGLVTARTPGRTVITVSDSATPAAVGSYDVTVTAAFYIDPKAMTLSPGETRTQAATGGTTPYIYTSSQPAVATVDAAGLVTAKVPGQTTITVRDSATPAAVGSYEVTVKDNTLPLTIEQRPLVLDGAIYRAPNVVLTPPPDAFAG